MLEPRHLYLTLMALAFAGPFFLSFDKKVAFYKYFLPLIKATIPVAIFFILWDIAFTRIEVWGFAERYTSGISLAGLPLGEYLFFLVIPYCCIFIYMVIQTYFPNDILKPHSSAISNFLMGFSASIAVIYYDHLYTVVNFSLLTLTIFYFSRIARSPWLGRFYLSFLVILIPFFIINGILTGSFIEEEVVWYDPEAIIGIRLGTVPLEDLFYAMTLILMVTGLFEFFRNRTARYETTTA